MSSNPDKAARPDPEPLNPDLTGQDPSATDPGADAKLQLQLAIFDVTRDAQGKSLDEIQEGLRAAFAARGVEAPPNTWLESVASSAFYGESYVIDFPAAIAADDAVPAPNKNARERLAYRRQLRQEKLPAGTFPSPAEWEVPASAITPARRSSHVHPVAVSRTRSGTRTVLVAVAAVMAVLMVIRAARGSGRRASLPVQSLNATARKDGNA
ncbi:hypothetical protein [Pseudarthrobacter niigatensis]|uniref:Uncharacterized protein n=1 Tax=Pseudarthrobacter niigatensis TaxID=369935 RepID=A0AAJ1SUW6_9MICC|nr:hypothetical protein [Pseudarthrobacter niigatensis]MDQ0147772.1 hypothetical protein [Pseudarthrobacter niigatensis]MDQ0267746.1 hypothetical protein [Pseudarthrobacter niigatensis]